MSNKSMQRFKDYLVKKWLWLKENKFNSGLLFCLTVLFIVLLNRGVDNNLAIDDNKQLTGAVNIFIQESCPHCHDLLNYLEEIKVDYPNTRFNIFDMAAKGSFDKMMYFVNLHHISMGAVKTPFVVSTSGYMFGFNRDEKSRAFFRKLVEGQEIIEDFNGNEVDLKFFGKINTSDFSLPMLTLIMGLADGFNPCAMWVLIYLISICSILNDKKKVWLLVGTFVLSSGVLYYLFMTAWLNVFLLFGYLHIVSLLIGVFALYFGTISLYEYIKTNGGIVCKLQDNKTRKDAMSRIEKLVNADLSMFTIMGIIGLAFVVNSIEFACSAALPATYTYVLSQARLSTFGYYAYIFFYDVAFMLDDMIVFGCAVFALNKYAGGNRYEKYSTLIGGAIMVLIGILLLFFPNLLH